MKKADYGSKSGISHGKILLGFSRCYGRTVAAMIFCVAAVPMSSYGQKEAAVDKMENIAQGRKYTLLPKPNYELCSDGLKDYEKLTDGKKYSGSESLWCQKGYCVGWGKPYAIITIDIGKVESIGGVVFHTAFDGPNNVLWPSHISVFVSEDNNKFYYACDLVDHRWHNKQPSDIPRFTGQRHTFYEYRNISLATKGRYVSFAVQSSNYIFCDEIEVYRSAESLTDKPLEGKCTTDIESFLNSNYKTQKVRDVLYQDLNNVRENALAFNVESQIAYKITEMEKDIMGWDVQSIAPDYRAVTPLNDKHSEIFKINAEIMRLHGMQSVNVWSANRWDFLNAADIPKDGVSPALSFHMMNNEYRNEILNLTNADSETIEVIINFSDLPGGSVPAYMGIYKVDFVGTSRGEMIADPLTPLDIRHGGYSFEIPSGMTRQIWLSCNPRALLTGAYDGGMIIALGKRSPIKVPLHMKIYPFQFPDHPHLSLAVWDYTENLKNPYFKSITKANVNMAIVDMKAHYVNTVWGHRGSVCWPEKSDFDESGNLVKSLRTEAFDDWIRTHKGYSDFFFYLGYEDKMLAFADEPIGTKKFEHMVTQWVTMFVGHARSIGIEPWRIAFEFLDEPQSPEAWKTNAIWGRIIKAAAPEIRIFTDAGGYEEPNGELEDMLKTCDVICPHLPSYANRMDDVRNRVHSISTPSKKFWFYSCMGPSRLLDPYYYHRLQAWYCWKNGAVGMGFWNYWNDYKDGGTSAWNELFSRQVSFGMVYTTSSTLTTSKHWEAVREGVEDYEYLVMLSDRVEEMKGKGQVSDVLSEAEELLRTLPEKVAGNYFHANTYWCIDKDRKPADQARIEILESLEKLNNLRQNN